MYSFLSIYTQAANEDKVMKQLATGSFSFNGCRILKRAGLELVGPFGEQDIYCLDIDKSELPLLREYKVTLAKWKARAIKMESE